MHEWRQTLSPASSNSLQSVRNLLEVNTLDMNGNCQTTRPRNAIARLHIINVMYK
jgi:hypothetical protein